MAFIEFRDVCKTYQMGSVEVRAVWGLSFEAERGEMVVIVGPSGAGKSTLLNMLGGMDRPTSGSIVLDGREIARLPERDLTLYRRYDVGFVFQFYNLVQNLTARENVELASQICPEPLPAERALAAVGLEGRMDYFPAQLSGGEQQRVAIARALAKNPKLMLADEPTGALDYQTGKQVLGLLQDCCHDMGMTVAIVTHNSAFTGAADRVVRLREGHAQSVETNDSPLPADLVEW